MPSSSNAGAEAALREAEARIAAWQPGEGLDLVIDGLAVIPASIYTYPVLGERAVADIVVDDVLAVLRPIWSIKNETSS